MGNVLHLIPRQKAPGLYQPALLEDLMEFLPAPNGRPMMSDREISAQNHHTRNKSVRLFICRKRHRTGFEEKTQGPFPCWSEKKEVSISFKRKLWGNLHFPGDSTLDQELTVGSLFGGDLKVWGFPGDSVVKKSICQLRDVGSVLGSGRCPGEGNGNPLLYSCLGNPTDRGAWQAIVHWVAEESDITERLNNNRSEGIWEGRGEWAGERKAADRWVAHQANSTWAAGAQSGHCLLLRTSGRWCGACCRVIPTDGRGNWDPGGSTLVLSCMERTAGILSEQPGLAEGSKGICAQLRSTQDNPLGKGGNY